MSHSNHGGGHDMHHGMGDMPMEKNLQMVGDMSHKEHKLTSNAHELHKEHSDHTMSHMMSMTFHGGYAETILFQQWSIDTVGGLIGSFIAIFLMALLYEGLKYYRKHLLWKTYAGLQYCAVAPPDKNTASDDPHIIQPVGHMVERKTPTMLSVPHSWQTVLHAIQVFVSYMLMLIFMTYNSWLCVAVVLGSATGYFLFGWRESVVVDFTEHCH